MKVKKMRGHLESHSTWYDEYVFADNRKERREKGERSNFKLQAKLNSKKKVRT